MAEAPKARRPQGSVSGASIAVAAFSTIVEWYDFTLYLYLATVLSRVFFGGGEAALITTLATFAIAYLLRPLGGMVFGHIGDRFGRRRTILLSMAIMTVTMLGTALLPTRAQAGAVAGGLLFLLRCIMGFSVGGEYNAIVAYLLEGAPSNRRGLIASMASASSEVGGTPRRRRIFADRQFDESRKFKLVGMAHPLSRRRCPGGKCVDRPHHNGRIAGVQRSAGKGDGA